MVGCAQRHGRLLHDLLLHGRRLHGLLLHGLLHGLLLHGLLHRLLHRRLHGLRACVWLRALPRGPVGCLHLARVLCPRAVGVGRGGAGVAHVPAVGNRVWDVIGVRGRRTGHLPRIGEACSRRREGH